MPARQCVRVWQCVCVCSCMHVRACEHLRPLVLLTMCLALHVRYGPRVDVDGREALILFVYLCVHVCVCEKAQPLCGVCEIAQPLCEVCGNA